MPHRGARSAAGAACVRSRIVDAEAGGGRGPGAGVTTLGVTANTALVNVPTPAMGRPGGEA